MEGKAVSVEVLKYIANIENPSIFKCAVYNVTEIAFPVKRFVGIEGANA